MVKGGCVGAKACFTVRDCSGILPTCQVPFALWENAFCQSFLIVICRLTRNLGCRSLWTLSGTARGRFWISWFCHWKKWIGFLSHPDSSTLPQITFWPPLWKDKTTSVLKVSKEIVPDSGQVLKSRPRGRSQMNQKEDMARSILKHPDPFTRIFELKQLLGARHSVSCRWALSLANLRLMTVEQS